MKLTLLVSLLLAGLFALTVDCHEGGEEAELERRMEEEEERNEVHAAERDEGNPERSMDKRNSNCGLKSALKPVPTIHSACLNKSPYLVEELVPSAAERTEIVNYHNELRSKVSPPAADMMQMEWDEDLALTAQHWASHCESGHDTYEKRDIPGRYSVGQNMYTQYGEPVPWKDMIDGWYDEVKDFAYGRGSTGGVVGHYTQVVAAKSSKIGCGAAKCNMYGQTKTFTFCNYAPAGNYKFGNVDEVKNPYKQGSKQCSDCAKCVNGLCVCEDTETTTDVCYNKGKLNPNDCACDCTNSPYIGKKCETCLDFPGGAKDLHMSCAAAKGRNFCRFSNVKRDCCATCG